MRGANINVLIPAISRATFETMIKRILVASLLIISSISTAAEIRVAVASNFTHTLQNLARQFESKSDHDVTLIVGSTGQHYAHIKNGAPFDAFFAADSVRPEMLDAEGIALPGTRFTYATGKLVLWHPDGDSLEGALALLQQGQFRFLAVANPKLAPYGKAAEEVLQAVGVLGDMRGKMVWGQNVGQAYQFVESRNAELGFIAYSQLKTAKQDVAGAFWAIPQMLYTPIRQQAVLLTDNAAARDFWRYVKSHNAQHIIREHGYDTPQESALVSQVQQKANDGIHF